MHGYKKICAIVETIEHNITHIPSHLWKNKMFSFGKYVPITSIAEKDKQFNKNESSGQNFMRKRDDVKVKIIEKIKDECDKNLLLKNMSEAKIEPNPPHCC